MTDPERRSFRETLLAWLRLRVRRLWLRLLLVVQLVAALKLLMDVALFALYLVATTTGRPVWVTTIGWLDGPAWLVFVGLLLRVAVSWIVFDLARRGRRRLTAHR